MRNKITKSLKKININLSSQNLIQAPLKSIKKIDINKFKKITSFSLNKTFNNFKEKIKQAEKERIKLLKKEKIKEAKKVKLEKKKTKIRRSKAN